MKRLIVNADDFGVSEKRNLGIVEAHRRGIVTSASLMANGAAFDHAVALARECPRLDVGLHLNLSEGLPVAPGLRTLVGPDGHFFGKAEARERAATGQFALEEVEREVAAQLARLAASGLSPTHVDGHQHIHVYGDLAKPVAWAAVRARVRWVRLPVDTLTREVAVSADRAGEVVDYAQRAAAAGRTYRAQAMEATDHFGGIALSGHLTLDRLLATLSHLLEGTTELMVHPGYADSTNGFAGPDREVELKALTHPSALDTVRAHGVELASFAMLA